MANSLQSLSLAVRIFSFRGGALHQSHAFAPLVAKTGAQGALRHCATSFASTPTHTAFPGASPATIAALSHQRQASSTTAAKPAAVGRATKPKILRDPERPKKPTTPWMSYLMHFRVQNASKATPLPNKEVMKAASTEWKALGPFDRHRWEEPYEVAKREYDARFKEYVDSGKKDAWKRDPEKPKKPLSGYMRFAQEKRPQYRHLKVTEQAKELASLWKGLPAEKKAPYEKAYAAEKEIFDVDMKKYKESGKEEAFKKKTGLDKSEKVKLKLKEAAEKDKLKRAKAKAAEAAKKAKENEKKAAMKLKLAKKKAKDVLDQAAKNLKDKQKQASAATKLTVASKPNTAKA